MTKKYAAEFSKIILVQMLFLCSMDVFATQPNKDVLPEGGSLPKTEMEQELKASSSALTASEKEKNTSLTMAENDPKYDLCFKCSEKIEKGGFVCSGGCLPVLTLRNGNRNQAGQVEIKAPVHISTDNLQTESKVRKNSSANGLCNKCSAEIEEDTFVCSHRCLPVLILREKQKNESELLDCLPKCESESSDLTRRIFDSRTIEDEGGAAGGTAESHYNFTGLPLEARTFLATQKSLGYQHIVEMIDNQPIKQTVKGELSPAQVDIQQREFDYWVVDISGGRYLRELQDIDIISHRCGHATRSFMTIDYRSLGDKLSFLKHVLPGLMEDQSFSLISNYVSLDEKKLEHLRDIILETVRSDRRVLFIIVNPYGQFYLGMFAPLFDVNEQGSDQTLGLVMLKSVYTIEHEQVLNLLTIISAELDSDRLGLLCAYLDEEHQF